MAKTKAAPRKRKPRTRQGFLPDMEPPSHKDIDDAAEDYVDARDARMRMLKTEIDAKGRLLERMREHALTTYKTPEDYVVTVDQLAQIKVKKAKAEAEANGESEE